MQKFVNKWLPDEKLMPLDKYSDAVNVIRRIGNQKRKVVHYRDRRPHLLAEHVEAEFNEDGKVFIQLRMHKAIRKHPTKHKAIKKQH